MSKKENNSVQYSIPVVHSTVCTYPVLLENIDQMLLKFARWAQKATRDIRLLRHVKQTVKGKHSRQYRQTIAKQHSQKAVTRIVTFLVGIGHYLDYYTPLFFLAYYLMIDQATYSYRHAQSKSRHEHDKDIGMHIHSSHIDIYTRELG